MSISASLVMELRSRTGAGMMECKKALTETNGDLEAAIEHMRKTGMAKADKKADRIAAEGRVAIAFAKDAKRGAIVEAQAAASGKPPEIVAKMVDGRLRKFAAESSLLGQPFVKDPDTTVEKLVKQAGATVHGFVRYAVGEGIEKAKGDFVAEVMAQARGG